MTGEPALTQMASDELVVFVLKKNLRTVFAIDWPVGALVLGSALILLFLCYLRTGMSGWRRFEIEQAKLGLGKHSLVLRPNTTDQQIAYRLWVELSTRKIGLPIDLDEDVIVQVYDSWYAFFAVTRELIKDVPVSKLRRNDTQKIIRLSIEILNTGMRPHLTKWQARFRHWYEHELVRSSNSGRSPQEVQKDFPEYEALKQDIAVVNQHLINYRDKMYELATH